jgi:hypothetical protein
MRTFKLLICLMFLCTAHSASAQRILTGSINNIKDEPIVGASIVEKGTTNGVCSVIWV